VETEHLLRYQRHLQLAEFNPQKQRKLAEARVLIVGIGGLGSPVALYLAAAGVGQLILADADNVDLSNLQRQIVHSTPNLGQAKVQSAQHRLHALNPDTRCQVLQQKLAGDTLNTQVTQADVVVDCSDNFTTRFALNRACVKARVPLVSGAAQQFSGQVSVFLLNNAQSPCYHCLYPEASEQPHHTCSETGVIAPLVGIIGSLQAAEVIKILLNIGHVLCGRLLAFDAYHARWRQLQLSKDPTCPVCALGFTTPEEH